MATWRVAEPRGSARPVHEFPPYDDDLADLHVVGARLAGAELPDGAELTDVRLDGCDVAGLVAPSVRVRRAALTGTRLRGVTLAGAYCEDVTLDDVTGGEVSVRFATLRRVVVRDSRLPGLDLTEATLDRVRFERCDLRGARLHAARVEDLRIEGCDLGGLSGAEALRGASVAPDDLAALAPSLALALGIAVEALADEPNE